MSKAGVRSDLRLLYFISFIEGGVVMVTEIAGAKLLTPYFGASLYSWASTLSITLLALMSGYYFGGYATTRAGFQSRDKICWVFFTSGITVLLMPSLGNFIMLKTISFSFFSGLIISQLFFLFLPIFLMGMISPLIIFHITKRVEESGRSAGNIYAISTSGGILFTLLFGFFIIPSYGITLPLRVLGIGVTLTGLAILRREKIKGKTLSIGLFIACLTAAMAFRRDKSKEFSPGSNFKTVTYSEGLLGELQVYDEMTKAPDGRPVSLRKLRTNNVQQNYVFTDMPGQSLLYYVNFTKQLIKLLPKKRSALVIGLGAGSLYKVLSDQGIPTETVEIDRRIYDIGVKYFAMPPHQQNNVITDGRYFINVTKKKYDLIILDVIIGESVPGQLITLESFRRLGQLLNDGGTLIVEHGGVYSFADNSFVPSIVNTLKAADFHVNIFNPILSESHGDILFVATKNNFDMSRLSIGDDVLIKGGPVLGYAMPLSAFDQTHARVFTDDRNEADILLKSHYFTVRKRVRNELAKFKSMKVI